MRMLKRCILPILCACVGMAIIGLNVAAASAQPKTVSQCKKKYAHNTKARTACVKRVQKATKPSSGGSCSLEANTQNNGGHYGDVKDLGVSFKFVGNAGPTEPGTIVAEVVIHTPKITICNAVLTGVVPVEGGTPGPHGETPYREVSFPVSISLRGGTSHPVTVPAIFDEAKVTVRAKRG